jgi:predicted NAD-dependent protein-ADP-ribosyltransferase YbiA (DUF1768 family)
MYPAKVPMNIGGEDYIFDNAEAAFQAQKNPSLAKMFLGLNGFQAKSQGRRIPITTPNWDTARVDAMRKAVQAKFDNNADLMKMLQDTGVDYISEDNDWGDTFWGMSGGKGKNMLGNILMDIRDATAAAAPGIASATPTQADDAIVGAAAIPELHKLYTSYFGNDETNILPNNVPVSIGMGKASSILGDKISNFDVDNPLRKLVAPDYNNILRPYQLNHNVDEYTEKYLQQLDSNKDSILQQASNLPEGTILDCYETPEEFCHRNLLADWLNNNGNFDVSEWQNGKTHLNPTTVQGDLLDTDIPLVIQQVNNRGVMGAGLARQIRDDLTPEGFQKYRSIAVGDPSKIGKTLPLKSKTVPNRTYLNIIGQDTYGGFRNPDGTVEPYDKVFTDMTALENAFTNIANRYPANTPIAMPVGLGSGHANGNWEDIEALADRILGSKLNLFKYKK